MPVRSSLATEPRVERPPCARSSPGSVRLAQAFSMLASNPGPALSGLRPSRTLRAAAREEGHQPASREQLLSPELHSRGWSSPGKAARAGRHRHPTPEPHRKRCTPSFFRSRSGFRCCIRCQDSIISNRGKQLIRYGLAKAPFQELRSNVRMYPHWRTTTGAQAGGRILLVAFWVR